MASRASGSRPAGAPGSIAWVTGCLLPWLAPSGGPAAQRAVLADVGFAVVGADQAGAASGARVIGPPRRRMDSYGSSHLVAANLRCRGVQVAAHRA